ncbi:MAG: NAD(P)-dependent oxidoreductase [Alphaproteobacteria bacterium]|nr:NAD(P)-dependent oxidoreductase [Alphaproteobacteria bacterium]
MSDKTSELTNRTIGFIGLGFMGKPMARNLQAAGATMIIHSRSAGPVEELVADGMTGATSPADVAAQAEMVILMLTDTAAVELVLTGPSGILTGLTADTLVIDMGTTLMTTTQALAAKVHDAGGAYLDAPVSGGTMGAEAGTLTIMAGGDDDAMDRAAHLFDVLGAKATHVGGIGAGQVAKAANQVIVGLTIGAVAEGLSLARKAGIDPAKVREALGGGFADSRILEVHGKRMVDKTFAPGAKSTIQRKDMDQAETLAARLGMEMPATTLNRKLYDRMIAAGHGDLDHAALIAAIDPGAI